jgi:hypothetical protein
MLEVYSANDPGANEYRRTLEGIVILSFSMVDPQRVDQFPEQWQIFIDNFFDGNDPTIPDQLSSLGFFALRTLMTFESTTT